MGYIYAYSGDTSSSILLWPLDRDGQSNGNTTWNRIRMNIATKQSLLG